MSTDEITAFQQEILPQWRSPAAQALVRELVDARKLTRGQAAALAQFFP
jgi:hypothetical protein